MKAITSSSITQLGTIWNRMKEKDQCLKSVQMREITMKEYKIVRIKERPDLKETAAEWFHSIWGIPYEAYLESMDASLNGDPVQEWY